MISQPLSNLQREILKIYSTGMEEDDLHELKTWLAKHYAQKSIREADELWRKRGLSDEEMDKWLNEG